MAKNTAEFHADNRWGGHMDIGKRGTVTVNSFTNKGNTLTNYGIELWIRLKSYPIIRKESGRQVIAPCKLLELTLSDGRAGENGVSVTYDEHQLRFENKRSKQVVFISYTPGTWFQLAFNNGEVGQLGQGSGSIYVDGIKQDTSMVFPSDIVSIVIGNDLRRGDEVRFNPKYATESSLGTIRIYDHTLTKDEVYNNYLSDARRYGLILHKEGSVVRPGLILELVANPEAVAKKQEYWYSTRELHAHESTKQNNSTDYMASKQDIADIEAALRALGQQQQSHATQQTTVQSKGQRNMDGNIIILSRNPEMFAKHMQHKDPVTTNLIVQSQGSPSREDYASIFENPLKLKLLVNYLQSKPSHFLALLRSDILTNEQLVVLNSAIQGRDQGLASGANAVLEGFSDGGPAQDPSQIERYAMAVELLQQKLSPAYGRAQAQAAQPLNQIADLMQYNHDRRLLQEKMQGYGDYMKTIRELNDKVGTVNQRQRKLEQLLTQQADLMGVMMSRTSGKCVGAIQRDGHIQHCAHRDAQSPYDIIVRGPSGQLDLGDLMQQRGLHGETAKQVLRRARKGGFTVLGQCVNIQGQTVAVIVRRGGGNHYIPTATSDPLAEVPILAILSEIGKKYSVKQQPSQQQQQEKQQTQSGPACSSGKCLTGYRPVSMPGVASEDWLQQETKEQITSQTRPNLQSQAEARMEAQVEAAMLAKQPTRQEHPWTQESPLTQEHLAESTQETKSVLGRIAARLV